MKCGGAAGLRRRARAGATALRSGLRNRRRLQRGDETLRPLFCTWTMTDSCNFDCAYRVNHRNDDVAAKADLDTAEGLRLLRIMRTGTSAMCFSGGEPILRSDLPVLTRAAWNLGYYPLMVNTDAGMLHRRLAEPEWADWLAHLDVAICSLDAVDPDTLDTLYCGPVGATVIRNVLLARAVADHTGIKIVVNCVIRPDALDDTAAVLDFAAAHDIWFAPVPMSAGAAPGLVDDREYRALAVEIVTRRRAGAKIVGPPELLERLLFHTPLTCHPTLMVHIAPDGTVLWPCTPALGCEPVRLAVLDYPSVDAAWKAACARLDPAGFAMRCGSDCGWAQNYATELYAEGLPHPFRSGIVSQVREFAGA